MKKFNTLTTTAVPLLIDNIDTDQIIPARFLKTTVKTGIGEHLFCDWRKQADGSPNPDFVLNQEKYSGKILFAGDNFGCGSSREHAVWALLDYGFEVVVSTSFADIFKNNALNNGLLPIQVTQEFWERLKDELLAAPSTQLFVDLPGQSISSGELGASAAFEIDPFRKECIINGYTDLDYLVSIKEEITAFEQGHPVPAINF